MLVSMHTFPCCSPNYLLQTAKNGQAGQCRFNKNKVQTSVSGCLSSLNDENRLKTMVASHGPAYVSVAVLDSFRQYKDGKDPYKYKVQKNAYLL